MNDHEAARALLALGAAGLLDAEGERVVREHTSVCEACRAALAELVTISGGLAVLPVAPPHPALLWRTQSMMAAEMDRRQGLRFAALAGVFGGLLLLLFASAVHRMFGDSAVVAWIAWFFVPSVLGGAAALTLASRRRLERSAQ